MKGEHRREPPLRRCQNHVCVCVLAAGGVMCRVDEELEGLSMAGAAALASQLE